MAAMTGSWALKGFGMFSMVEKRTARWLGRVGPWQPEGWPGTEIGWGLIKEAWGQGYAIEGATRAIDWAFTELAWDDVIHCIHPENARSIALAIRLGSSLRAPGRLPAPFEALPVEIWGQTRAEWRALRGKSPAFRAS
jgi:RimJ/RimL family protein N-acetyltransferase